MMLVPTKLHIFSGWGYQQNKNGIVVYSHVERNLAVGEVNSTPYKIEMDLPKIKEQGTACYLNFFYQAYFPD